MSRINSITNAAFPLTSIEAPRPALGLVSLPNHQAAPSANLRHANTERSKATEPPSRRTKPTPPDALWDARAVAEFLGASASYVYKKVQAGKIPFVRIGWMVRFSPDAIRAWVKARAK